MLARVPSAALIGIEALLLTIECDLSPGLPQFHTVGLPDAAVRESADRVRAALRNAGFRIPPRRITVGLAPADLRKQGAALDLPIALGLLAAQGEVPAASLETVLVLGELALDGRLRPVPGCLPAALLARRLGLSAIMVPADNRDEALAVPGPGVHGVASLAEAVAVLRSGRRPEHDPRPRFLEEPPPGPEDLAEVRGQAHARRALEVAAAGGHHLLMVGPPGCGKTMLARRLPGILPPLSLEEAIEVSCIYSAASLLPHPALLRRRPFRAPHHTISGIGLVGGGRGPRPGEATLAHRGVLFLDELPEFGRATLDVLRQPLEEGDLVIHRAHRATRLPARFMLVAAMNPCPCGQQGRGDRPCACTPAMVAHYRGRISGPLLDRFEVQVEVAPVAPRDLEEGRTGEASVSVARRVAAARRRRDTRLVRVAPAARASEGGPPAAAVALDHASRRLLRRAIDRLGLSARAHDAVIRVARTIADLAGAETIGAEHLAEAIQYRTLDRRPRGDA